ncbi:MAG: helix-hairpin-helix domain-containing protein [Candidatus Omnitrophica bacterium]|nr:helix-hairpin-helix domain-containing protein [Candidatus Omnitrophota bacterium]MDD5237087.1 helix-hairpin-helix domain-containing protein [Candidatus Omnitrophota bacterium]MDD5610966.1 helix-hairpin-helix domain-containing protein [Candidatus Omnitrophota bacterium]
MIARILGKLREKTDSGVVLDVNGLSYEVLMPSIILSRIEESSNPDGVLELVTYHYLSCDPSKNIPVLIGFLNEIEKDFFQQFITVSGIGPRAALKALNQPISLIAQAIDEGNTKFLQSLPGIGQQKAKLIVAKLQGKVGKFGLIQDERKAGSVKETGHQDIEDEALSVLLQLQYKKPEAVSMIKKALERAPDVGTTQELLNEVYRQRKVK